ncbi:MAG: hypothetical protein JO060_08555 [Candidatus Eremiobacteraeota bacterium]|nr:hypothetical protein [Candidatus Eremiobacteraeota bacterium]MBV9647057.1 hypothetical protein [Candidatus Eremiobacteraeota bacterium]
MDELHGGPGAHGQPEIPVSAGTPVAVHILFVMALVLILAQGLLTVLLAGFGRIWPAANSVKIPL